MVRKLVRLKVETGESPSAGNAGTDETKEETKWPTRN
jgi:hypothetical protein